MVSFHQWKISKRSACIFAYVFLLIPWLFYLKLRCSEIPFSQFRFPLDTDMQKLVTLYKDHRDAGYTPINLYPYAYINSHNICTSAKEVFVIFLIKSKPTNLENRQAIRDTWTNNIFFENVTIRHVFLIAQPKNASRKSLLFQENQRYRDIVELSFIDDYYNNTYKTIGGLNWSVKYCYNAKFVMLVDDDFFVATDELVNYLQKVPKDNLRKFFRGHVVDGRPWRTLGHKWYMPIYDYPFDKYPPFISAGATIMSMEFVTDLSIAIKFTRILIYDDVFLAVVAYKLGVKPVDISRIKMDLQQYSYTSPTFQNALAIHLLGDTKNLRAAWYFRLNVVKRRK